MAQPLTWEPLAGSAYWGHRVLKAREAQVQIHTQPKGLWSELEPVTISQPHLPHKFVASSLLLPLSPLPYLPHRVDDNMCNRNNCFILLWVSGEKVEDNAIIK